MPFLTGSAKATPPGTIPPPIATGPVPFLGTLGDIDPVKPTASLVQLTYKWGEIYNFYIPGVLNNYVVSSWRLVNECCDEKRFRKMVGPVLKNIRRGTHDGLFTAQIDEPNWGIAHRVLVPSFGPMTIRGMFDEMYDVASQCALKWARHGSAARIDVTDDFSRVAFDTLALCTMGYRFNSYYYDQPPKFFSAMADFLIACGDRTRRVGPSFLYRSQDRKFQEDIDLLRDTSREILEARKRDPTSRRDLLTAMLEGTDPKTGQKMTDVSIIDNLLTFLIAGHETTSGLLSFAFFRLLQNPETMRKAQQEVDEVVGKGALRPEHLPKLHYINAVLRETLRINSGIPIFVVEALNDEVLGGQYHIAKNTPILVTIAKSQLDPVVFGDDAEEFKPERMLDENFDRLMREFPNCWKPFGNGMRGCIGRPFAWQEALIVMAVTLQNFSFVMHDPEYKLDVQETLTVKPQGFYMRAALREGLTPTSLQHRLAGSQPATANGSANGAAVGSPQTNGAAAAATAGPATGTPISIFYGSNSGTCEAMAHRLAADAASQGFRASVVDALDAAKENVPTDGPAVFITASYEGEPPDNAAQFVGWLESLKGKQADLSKAKYAVFGCGHHDWSNTFHRIPKLVDSRLTELGATRLAPLGLTDAAEGDMFVDFETWEFETLWPALTAHFEVDASDNNPSSALDVQLSTPRALNMRQDVGEAVVVAAHNLVYPSAKLGPQPLKRHIEIKLPADMTYSAGDYLAVLPINPRQDVARVMRRFGLAADAHVTINATGRTVLPTGSSVSVQDVLGAYVELAQPATKRGVLALAEACGEADAAAQAVHKQLVELAGDSYASEISAKRVSVLDLLERFPTVSLPFGRFLALLPPMRVRQYSISSSPMWNPGHVTLTYSVLEGAATSSAATKLTNGNINKDSESADARRHLGVASSYLASLAPGDHLQVAVRPSHVSFHLPKDPSSTPLIFIAAGSGLAPFRGFVQERAAQLAAGRQLAPLLLFFGCRDPDHDDLYRDELDRWEKLGAVSVRRAYSRRTAESEGCRHVQDRVWRDRDEVTELWHNGAKVFVCGSREFGEGVKEVVFRIAAGVKDRDEGKKPSREELQKWYDSIRNERYATDVFD